MTLRLPDFVIAGAPRSGTTWLTSALDRHPDIWLAKPRRPEPKFFLVDELYELGIEEYSRRWFADAPGGVQGRREEHELPGEPDGRQADGRPTFPTYASCSCCATPSSGRSRTTAGR